MAVRNGSMKKKSNTQKFHVNCKTWSSFIQLYKKNICHGFLFLSINPPPLTNVPLIVTLSLPGGHKLSLPGLPVRVQTLANRKRLRIVVKLDPISEENKQLMLALFDMARLDLEGTSAGTELPLLTKPTPPPLPSRARVKSVMHR